MAAIFAASRNAAAKIAARRAVASAGPVRAHEIRLTDRRIEGLGLDVGLAGTELPVMSDTRVAELDAEYRHGNVRVKVSTKALKQYSEQIVCRRRAWTTTR
jgi:hypothetical protein